MRVEEEGLASGTAEASVNYAGSYIDGTGDNYNHVVLTQSDGIVSYEWYTGDVYQYGETGLQISDDGCVYGAFCRKQMEH